MTLALSSACRAASCATPIGASARTSRAERAARGACRGRLSARVRGVDVDVGARGAGRDRVAVGGGWVGAREARGARRGDACVFAGARDDSANVAALTADQASEIASEVAKLKEELKENVRKVEKAQQESEEAETKAKAMAEQALLATEAYQKDEELALSAMNSTEDCGKSVIEAKVGVDAAIVRLKRVEEAIARSELAPTDDTVSNSSAAVIDEKVLKKDANDESAKDVIASKMGLKAAPWWETEGLTLEEAESTAVEQLKAAEDLVKETEIELARREEFATEVAAKAKNSLEMSKNAHDRADEAMSKISVKMGAVLELNETINRIEKELAEKQRLVDGVMFDESAVATITRGVETDVKSKEDIKMEVKEELADKRAAAAAEQAKKEPSTAVLKSKSSSKSLSAGYFTTSESTKSEEKDASAVLDKVKKIATAMLLFGSATLMLPAKPCATVRQRIGTSIVKVGSTAKSVTNSFRSEVNQFIERVVPESERKLAAHAAHEAAETGMTDVLWLLFTSVVAVQLVTKLPGGSPVLGFLLGGALVGPFGLGIITHVEQVKVLAEFGVVFLLFNIGLELSYQRLVSMAKYIFGLGSAQMALSTAVGTGVAVACGMAVPPAVIVGLGLAFSSTAVALQVLADRGESASRHGRATFSVLLFQDLTVVLVFMLVPLLAGPDSGSLTAIAGSLLKAIVKTGVAIGAIIGLGRLILRPVFDRVAKLRQAELMSATTLFVALGTSLLTQSLGLSMALGAFLAGLLLAETEFHLQVENDIAPFRGLLLGLFFMTVGMTIDPMTFTKSAFNIIAMMIGIVTAKIAVVAAVGPLFGLSVLNCVRAGMYIGPGGEFAFVTFAEAVRVGLFNPEIATQLNLAVVLTMAITPYLAEFGNKLKDVLQSADVASLQPNENEVDDLKGHVILAGYGRNGRIVGEILTQNLVPFVALDVRPEIVSEGRARDQNVYFGDAGSVEVLRAIGAARASCAVVALNSPGANYRAVWSLTKNFPNVQTYVRARDVEGGLVLEKAGAKAVVPETLEPALQLAAALLRETKMPADDITVAIDTYRRNHLKDLQSTQKLSVNYRQSMDEGFAPNSV